MTGRDYTIDFTTMRKGSKPDSVRVIAVCPVCGRKGLRSGKMLLADSGKIVPPHYDHIVLMRGGWLYDAQDRHFAPQELDESERERSTVP